MTKEEKVEIFYKEINYIKDQEIKQMAKIAIENLQDYFFAVPASSSGKYHPSYALGDGGLTRHVKGAVRIANHLLALEQNKEEFTTTERDLILFALLIHDGLKQGRDGSQGFTTFTHPWDCAEWVVTADCLRPFNIEYRKEVAKMIVSHMGEWNEDVKGNGGTLPKPMSKFQKFVHMCDFLASRKDIEILF